MPSIDLLKVICAIMVVLIHIVTPYTNSYIQFCRVAVPCFFMISGYFIFDADKVGLKKRIKRITVAFLWSFILYLVWWVSVNHSFSNIFTLENLKKLFLYNEVFFAFHLWYLPAYLYVLVVWYFAKSLNKENVLATICPLLLVPAVAFSKYSIFICNTTFDIYTFRNFLFTGLPFFSLGYLVKKHNDFIFSKLSSVWVLFGLVILCTIGVFEEQCFFIKSGKEGIGDIGVMTVFMAVFIFLLFLRLQVPTNVLTKIGRMDSLYIYIFHLGIGCLLIDFAVSHGFYDHISCLMPLIVFLVSLLLVHLLRRLKLLKGESFLLDSFRNKTKCSFDEKLEDKTRKYQVCIEANLIEKILCGVLVVLFVALHVIIVLLNK